MIPGIVAQATPGFPAPIGDGTVELLLGFNGTNGSFDFREEGQRNVPVSALGDVHISNVQAKFGSTSARFDGSIDGLIFPFHEGFEFGSGKFTVEGWFYPVSSSTQVLVCSRLADAAAELSWSVALVGSNRNLELIWSDGTTATNLTGTGSATLNGWNHFALCRGTDGVVRLFLNGVLQVSLPNATAGAMWNPKRFPLALGIIPGNLNASFNGFMDEVRVIKGEAVYDGSAAFTPPAAPFSRPVRDSLVPGVDPDFSNVLLLLGFDSADIYALRDDSPYKRKNVSRWNVGSFNNPLQRGIGYRSSQRIASPSYLAFDDSNDWAFGTDAFTVECWVRPNVTNGFRHILGQRNGSSNPVAWVLTLLASTGEMEYIASSGSTVAQQSSGADTVHPRSWNHVALARDATGVFRMFINGVMRAKDASKTALSIQNIAIPMTIGAGSGGGNNFTGEIDEVRITRGACRYPTDASFYPSFKPFSRGEIGPPVVSEQPEIISRSGFYAPGDVLDLDIGVADGREPAIQWRRGGVNVAGATGTSYAVTASDVGETIDARVTWWNYSGTTTATAAAVGPVAAEALFDTGGLAPAGDMQSGTDRLIPAGDMQSGTDVLLWKERTQ